MFLIRLFASLAKPAHRAPPRLASAKANKRTKKAPQPKSLRLVRAQVLGRWTKNARRTTTPRNNHKQCAKRLKKKMNIHWRQTHVQTAKNRRKMKILKEEEAVAAELKRQQAIENGEEPNTVTKEVEVEEEDNETDKDLGPVRVIKKINKLATSQRAKNMFHKERSSPYRKARFAKIKHSRSMPHTRNLEDRIHLALKDGKRTSMRFKAVVRRLRKITKRGRKRVVGPFNASAKKRFAALTERFARHQAKREYYTAKYLERQRLEMQKACNIVQQRYPKQWEKMWPRINEERIIPIQRKAPYDAPSTQIWCGEYYPPTASELVEERKITVEL